MEHTMQSGHEGEHRGRGPNRIAPRDPGGRDARSRIQAVALELFLEQGYERTSLREIADRLGVSKAALYYHFPTKEDIVGSLIDDRRAALDNLVAWMRSQPRTVESRREFLTRYVETLRASQHRAIMQFFERNQTSVSKLHSGHQLKDQMLAVIDLLAEPDAPLVDRIKGTMAIVTLHASWFIAKEQPVSDEELLTAALTVALEIIDGPAPAGG
jgi:AcrR family transcriptional regulator